jgi:hypothetical protein
MKYLLSSILRIVLYLILLLVPVLLFITFFALGRTGVPLWNIGIRNVMAYARNFFLPALILSYLIATLLVVALVDKMKVKSIVSLHLPALFVAVLIGAGVLFTRSDVPFTLPKSSLKVGPAQFFKEGVFIDAGNRKIQLAGGAKKYLYYYDVDRNTLSLIQNVSTATGGRNRLYVDDKKRQVVIEAPRSLEGGSVRIPFRDFPQYRNITDLPLFRTYGTRIGTIRRAVLRRLGPLNRMDRYIFLGSLLLTLLMVSIPSVFAMNDRGWGFSGIVGIFVVLALLPFFYSFLFRMTGRLETRLVSMGRYSYLVPALLCGALGILIDFIVASRSRSRVKMTRR